MIELTAPQDCCVLTYFDVLPESPDGSRIAYSRFTSGIPARRGREGARAGEVVVSDRDGNLPRVVGRFERRAGHTGAYVVWIDDDTLAWVSAGQTRLADLRTGTDRAVEFGVQKHHPAIGGIFCPRELAFPGEEPPLPHGLYRTDVRRGTCDPVVLLDQLVAHPALAGTSFGTDAYTCHPKWSPGGRRVATLLCDAGPGRPKGEQNRHLFTCNPDGADLRHFAYPRGAAASDNTKPMHWNFFDDESICGYDVASPGRPLNRWTLDGEYIETLHTGEGNHATIGDGGRFFVTDSWYAAERPKLMLYHRGDDEPTVLADSGPASLTDLHPTLSRDQRRAYFNRLNLTPGVSQLCAVDLNGLV